MSDNFNNFDILFQTSTADELDMYANALKNIRKGKKTKAQKIQALNDQMKLMNLMYNAGHQAGGNGIPSQLNPSSNDFLQMFHATDINSLWNEMNVPVNKTTSSILGDVKNVYGVMKYLDFTSSLDKSIDKQNENVHVKDIPDPPLVPDPDAHAPTIQELNKQRREFFKIRNKRNRVGRRGQALPIRSSTPEPPPIQHQNDDNNNTSDNDSHPIIQEMNEQKANDDDIIHQRHLDKRKKKKPTFKDKLIQRRRRLYESDSDDDVAVVNFGRRNDNSFMSEYSNYTPGRFGKKPESKPKPKSKHKKRMSSFNKLLRDAQFQTHLATTGADRVDYSAW